MGAAGAARPHPRPRAGGGHTAPEHPPAKPEGEGKAAGGDRGLFFPRRGSAKFNLGRQQPLWEGVVGYVQPPPSPLCCAEPEPRCTALGTRSRLPASASVGGSEPRAPGFCCRQRSCSKKGGEALPGAAVPEPSSLPRTPTSTCRKCALRPLRLFFPPLSLKKEGKKKIIQREETKASPAHTARPAYPPGQHTRASRCPPLPGAGASLRALPRARPGAHPRGLGPAPGSWKGLSRRERLFPSRPAPARSQQGPAVKGARLPPGPPKCPAEGRGCSRSAGNPAGY